MLQAIPRGVFSNDYEILVNGAKIVDIHRKWFTEAGELTVDNIPYQVYREGMLGDFVIANYQGVLTRATKSWGNKFTFTFQGREYVLKGRTFKRAFDLLYSDTVIGTIATQHAFTRKTDVELPQEFPLALQVFLLWLALTMWQRADSAASASAANSAAI